VLILYVVAIAHLVTHLVTRRLLWSLTVLPFTSLHFFSFLFFLRLFGLLRFSRLVSPLSDLVSFPMLCVVLQCLVLLLDSILSLSSASH
jgi:hypothetical protein